MTTMERQFVLYIEVPLDRLHVRLRSYRKNRSITSIRITAASTVPLLELARIAVARDHHTTGSRLDLSDQ